MFAAHSAERIVKKYDLNDMGRQVIIFMLLEAATYYQRLSVII